MIAQGDVFWADLGTPHGSAPGYRHPAVVVQNDTFNRSAINTVVVCQVTSNLSLAFSPGNVLLRKGEANLPKRSVVNVSQIVTLDKSELTRRIGTLAQSRVREIVQGIALVLEPAD